MIHLDAGFLKVALAGVPSPIVGLKTYPKPDKTGQTSRESSRISAEGTLRIVWEYMYVSVLLLAFIGF